MILLISAKDWLNDHKKLIEVKDYLILDCTDGQESKMHTYSNVVTMDNFCIPSKLLSAISKEIDDDYIDIDNAEELEKTFFRGNEFSTSVLATMSTFLRAQSDINIFIIVRNKAFKYYRKRFITEFCRVFPDADPLIKIYKHENKSKIVKILEKPISTSDRDILVKELEKKEKQMENSKSSSKKKKKKSKKKDNKGWGFAGKYKL